MNEGLSTFRFALYLLIGLTVFTVVVAVLSRFRYNDYEPKNFEAEAPTPAPAPAPESAESPEVDDDVAETKFFDIPEIGHMLPAMPKVGEVEGIPIKYGEENRPILVPLVDETHPGIKSWRSRMHDLVNRVFHMRTSPKNAADWLAKSAHTYLTTLKKAESLMMRYQGRVKVQYMAGMDEALVKSKSNYLANLKIFFDLYKDGVPGLPACVANMPSIGDMTNLPPLPPFDRLMRGGQDAQMVEYFVGRMMADPFDTIARTREHISQVLACSKNVNPFVEIPTRVVEVTPRKKAVRHEQMVKKLPPGVYGPLSSEEMPGVQAVTPTPTPMDLWQSPGALSATVSSTPAPTPTPPQPPDLIHPTFVMPERKELPEGVFGPYKPGEIPLNELKLTPTPTPKP
jgi:hypothetical protein